MSTRPGDSTRIMRRRMTANRRGGTTGTMAARSVSARTIPGRVAIARRALALLAAVTVGCAPGGVGAGPGEGVPESYAGTVRIVGSAPMNVRVVLEREGEAAISLGGELLPELETLRGARVTVQGRVVESPDPMTARQIEVAGYEILSINGAPVLVGEVIAVDDTTARLRTADGAEVLVTSAPRSFRVGQKVWVQGPREITVQSYGTLRP